MHLLLRTGFVVSAMAIASPLNAFAQAVTIFDGTYAGVSLTTNGTTGMCTVKSPVPGMLTISGGNAKTQQGDEVYQGAVNAQGALQLHSARGTLMYGKVDATGAATAGINIGMHGCTYNFAWKKK